MARKPTRDKDGWVFLKKGPAGNWRAKWYGRWMANGKTRETSLCAWLGTPPDNPAKEEGNATFEQSRERARKQLREAINGRRDAEDELRDAQKIYALRYGDKVARVKIADLAAKWDALPHKTDLSEARRDRVHSVLRRFKTFMEETFPNVKEAGALTAEHFQKFLDAIDKSGVSARSWNDYLTILRGVLAKVDGQGKGFREYLAKLPKKIEATIHRRPFQGSELDNIFTAAKAVDPELYPVLVAAACTALRRGDVCRLRWNAVDMEEGFATVKTTKTGETVDIPIFPPFRVVLEEAARRRKKGVPYVWPEIALAYSRNAHSLNHRLNRVLASAGFSVPKRHGEAISKGGGKYPAPEDAEAAAAMVEDGMEREGWRNVSKVKARRILSLHLEGRTGKEIAEALHLSRAGVSEYLHAMEDAGQIALVSEPKCDTPACATLAETKEGEQRKQRGSLCGWHSFRTTFCTLALANGVPMEILQKITGHRTTEIVLKHYDRRGREAMRKAIGAAMPKAIVGAIGDGVVSEGQTLDAKAVESGPIPANAMKLSRMLTTASPEQLAQIAAILQGGQI